MKQEIFWADQLADLIIKRRNYNYIDREVKNHKVLTIKSSTSISGIPHIGNASDVIRHDAVVRSLKDKGKKVSFIWVAEDMDPWRKIPSGIPKSFSKYLGMPVSSLPDPERCCENYVEHFVTLFLESLRENFGTNPKFLSTTEAYKKGVFYKQIKKGLDNMAQIKEIIGKYRKEKLPGNYSIWKPVCDNCGKIITPVIKNIEGNGVEYKCEDYEFKEFGKEAYNKIAGCGHKGFSDIKKGNGKLLWQIEWASEWSAWKIALEGAGKEHFMPTSSFWRAGEICERIFGWPEPYPGKNPIQPYEYIKIGGEKMSASRGNVVATWEWPKFAPAELLRFIFLKRPNRERDFKYGDIPRMVEELDNFEKIYFGLEKIENKKELIDAKRLFEQSSIRIIKKYRNPISFGLLGMLSQVYPKFENCIPVLKRVGYVKFDKKLARERFEQARIWANKYAPEDFKFSLQISIPNEIKKSLTSEQKKAIRSLKIRLEKKEFDEQSLFNEFYKICKEVGIKNTEFFKAAYLVLINKEKGPRLAPFILTIGKDKVIRLFNKL